MSSISISDSMTGIVEQIRAVSGFYCSSRMFYYPRDVSSRCSYLSEIVQRRVCCVRVLLPLISREISRRAQYTLPAAVGLYTVSQKYPVLLVHFGLSVYVLSVKLFCRIVSYRIVACPIILFKNCMSV